MRALALRPCDLICVRCLTERACVLSCSRFWRRRADQGSPLAVPPSGTAAPIHMCVPHDVLAMHAFKYLCMRRYAFVLRSTNARMHHAHCLPLQVLQRADGIATLALSDPGGVTRGWVRMRAELAASAPPPAARQRASSPLPDERPASPFADPRSELCGAQAGCGRCAWPTARLESCLCPNY
jgi:hypothetical protein